MAVEQFANEAETELAADVDSGEFEIAVVSANGFPEEPQFRIRVDDELMRVHTVNGTTWGVSRDIEVTGIGLGVPHAAGAKVTHVLTAGGLLNLNPSQQTSGDALAGQVLTADGAGGSAWEDNDAQTLQGLAPDATGAADAHVVATDENGIATLQGVSIHVRASSAQTISSGTVTPIAFDLVMSEEKPPGLSAQWTSGSPTRVVCRVAGRYMIYALSSWQNNGTGARELALHKNGTALLPWVERIGNAGTSAPTAHSLTAVAVPLAAGDYIELSVRQHSGGNLDTAVVGWGLRPSLVWYRLP